MRQALVASGGAYHELFDTLHEARVAYAIAGGFAAVLHVVPRMTFDLDLVVDPSDASDETLCGAATIVASYRASHERAAATLDRIAYRSSFEVIAPGNGADPLRRPDRSRRPKASLPPRARHDGRTLEARRAHRSS